MPSDAFPESGVRANVFTHGPLPAIFAKTALPVIFVMMMNGLLSVADAIFLGHYVGPQALGAVTLVFPAFMLIVALGTLVGSGMSSQLARSLGAGDITRAQAVFAGAHGLALLLGGGLAGFYLIAGAGAVSLAAQGSAAMAAMARTYLSILVFAAPLSFLLSVQSDALRNEGRAGLMAAMSLLVSLANITFNYLLIAVLEMGVAGSAIGTVLAQVLSLAVILGFRLSGRTELRLQALLRHPLTAHWSRTLALGAPQSLNFIGLSLGTAAVLTALQLTGAPGYGETVAAYGIVTRILTFGFLPLLGLMHALQSITGNNYGAGLWQRSDAALRFALACAFVYCLTVQLLLSGLALPLAMLFTGEGAVAQEVARILPVIVSAFFAAGPLLIIAAYFQAIGDAARAALLGLAKTYGFAIPLTFLLPIVLGEPGIWLAGPVAEGLQAVLTAVVLAGIARRGSLAYGLFRA